MAKATIEMHKGTIRDWLAEFNWTAPVLRPTMLSCSHLTGPNPGDVLLQTGKYNGIVKEEKKTRRDALHDAMTRCE